MTALLEQMQEMISRLSRPEKAQVLQWVVSDLGDAFPGIDTHPGVSGGEACIVRTRIPVWMLVQARQLGVSESQLLLEYPQLTVEDLAEAWAYARSHREEIDQHIAINENA
jgi:uncharacterized protein (DUF433 family)